MFKSTDLRGMPTPTAACGLNEQTEALANLAAGVRDVREGGRKQILDENRNMDRGAYGDGYAVLGIFCSDF